MSICELSGVSKHYGSGVSLVKALDQIDLTFDSGEFTVIGGPSGSGKTTLLNLVGCLDCPTSGQVVLEGREVGGLGSRELSAVRAKRIGFIFQSFNLIPVLTARENVELALQLGRDVGADRRQRAEKALVAVGLESMVNRRPNQLSGGQQQRVAIARALVKSPALVIADEPTANLDSKTGTDVLGIMQRMNRDLGVTFLFSTHDPMVIEHARRVVHLRDGCVVEDEIRDSNPVGKDG
jgi:putative ABC transport system ATP-binding protein